MGMEGVWSPQALLVAISKADGLQRKLAVWPIYIAYPPCHSERCEEYPRHIKWKVRRI
jgi:hypothetical protein